ncbi:MAG TPA: hypothetical protein VFR41_14080 [Acidimicrobiia bacterium]|nr:hypothetical protein [Acidimicrobiia bacterium]
MISLRKVLTATAMTATALVMTAAPASAGAVTVKPLTGMHGAVDGKVAVAFDTNTTTSLVWINSGLTPGATYRLQVLIVHNHGASYDVTKVCTFTANDKGFGACVGAVTAKGPHHNDWVIARVVQLGGDSPLTRAISII